MPGGGGGGDGHAWNWLSHNEKKSFGNAWRWKIDETGKKVFLLQN